jgi:cytosine/uracil/thiamine/allantoin permease
VILFSLVMLVIVRFGLSTLSWTALAAGVATLGLAAYGLFLALGEETSAAPPDVAGGGLEVVGGAALVIGFGAAFALRTPDFTHDLARPRQVVWCAVTGLAVPLAAFFAAGVVLQRTTGEWNLADVLLELDSATVAYLFLMIGFSGSVLTNLYSGALALRQTVGGLGPDRALLLVAIAGGALALGGLADHMLGYLAVMALAASGLIVLSVLHQARGLAIRDGWRLPGLAAWTVGFLLGLALQAAGSPLALPVALVATGAIDLLMSSARRAPGGAETAMGDE